MDKREEKEQRILSKYKNNLYENELELEGFHQKEQELEVKEQERGAFKQGLFWFLEHMAMDSQEDLGLVQEKLHGGFQKAEFEYREQQEIIQAEKRRLYAKEEAYTEQYNREMRGIEEETTEWE